MSSVVNVSNAQSTCWYQSPDILNPRYWGASLEHGLCQFQVFSQLGDFPKNHITGLPYKEIVRLSEKGKAEGVVTQLFFNPNPVETEYFKKRVPLKLGKDKTSTRLARIDCFYVDIDCFRADMTDGEHEQCRLEAVDRIFEFCSDYGLSKESVVLIDSGWGYHFYLFIEPVRLLGMDTGDDGPEYREYWESRFLSVQKEICKILEGDKRVANRAVGKMRVPGTWNVKPERGARTSRYLFGDLVSARIQPTLAFEQVEESLGIIAEEFVPLRKRGSIQKPKPKGKIPKRELAGFANARRAFEKCTGSKLTKFQTEYLKFLFGYRNRPIIFEATFKRMLKENHLKKIKSCSGSALKSFRNSLIDQEFLTLHKKHEIERRGKSWEYKLTDKFFLACEVERKYVTNSRREHQEKIIARVTAESYSQGQRRVGYVKDWKTLRQAGVSESQAQKIIKSKIKNRPQGCDTSDLAVKEFLDYIAYLKRNFKKAT